MTDNSPEKKTPRSEPETEVDSVRRSITISAIVSTHNRARYLVEALDSLLNQEHPLDELIVINDASTDNTRDILAGYQDRARVIELTTNQGKPAAMNRAIPEAVGDFIWIFDDDDVALPDALSRHVELLGQRRAIDFTYSDTYHSRDSENIWNREAWRVNRPSDAPPEQFMLNTLWNMNTPTLGMLISRRALLDIGMFDTKLYRCQDLDLLIRLGAARYKGAKVDAATFVYREHDGPRGIGQNAYSIQQRFRTQHEYRKQVFRKARDTIPLSDYLMHLTDDSVLHSDQAREPAARFQRGCLLLHQGMVDDGLADLGAALGHPAIGDIEHAWIAYNLARALDVEPWMFEQPRGLVIDLARLLAKHEHFKDYAGASARGLYWSVRRETELRRSRQVLSGGLLLGGFLASCVGYRIKRAVFKS